MTDDDLRAILMQIKDLAMKPIEDDQDLLFILGQIVGLCVSGLVKKSDRPE